MKKILSLIAAVLAAVTVCGAEKVHTTPKEVKLARQDRIFLPEEVYAVPGIECNIYFKNVFLAVNHANYVFDVECSVGAQRKARWTFVPQKTDENKSYPLELKVYDEDENLVAKAETVIKVVPSNAGNGKEISILMIGDSLTATTVYPGKLRRHCLTPGNPKLKMIGAHAGKSKSPVPGGVAHEGYGGWTWKSFYTNYRDEKDFPDERRKFAAKSRFLTMRDGKVVFDFANYLKKYNGGKTPDYITIQLGVNDVCFATAEQLDSKIKEILKNADTLIGYLRKDAPETHIGIGFVTRGADQDAFGTNYKCRLTWWSYFRNSFRLNQAMQKHFKGKKNISMIPVNVNLDVENNFPTKAIEINPQLKVTQQNNGVHPGYWGYIQMGDSYYAWLKYRLSL